MAHGGMSTNTTEGWKKASEQARKKRGKELGITDRIQLLKPDPPGDQLCNLK